MFRTIKKIIFGFSLCLAMHVAIAQTSDPFSLKQSLGLSQSSVQGSNSSAYTVNAANANALTAQQQAQPKANSGPSPVSGDHAANQTSEVFGANLFTGAFAKEGPGRFNPEYAIMVGDRIQIRLWGGFEFDGIVEVDPKGNIFLPHVGPVQVLGTRNDDLQKAVDSSVRRIFRANVYSYASLAAAQPVRVFVGGNVSRPGLYNGTSMDSLLSYLDQAGGVDTERGSFLSIQVKRGERVRATVNLYEFLLQGRIPLVQLAEGDVIFVPQRQLTVKVSGLVASAKRFEFSDERRTVADLISVARPKPVSTHVRIVRNTGDVTNTEYFPLAQASQVELMNGDELEFTADKRPGTIAVRVIGEHQSAQEYVLPYGTRFSQLMGQIQYSDRSDKEKPQLFRLSVKERQRQILSIALKSLESTVLTTRSGTVNEATLRSEDAKQILQWIERAKTIEPAGQVLIAQAEKRGDLLLENGDIIKIPTKDGLVLIGGEVLFPNAVAFDSRLSLDAYIKAAGGYTQNSDGSRIVVAHRDGSYEEGGRADIVAGDEILVLPKVDIKYREIAKDITQMLYQIAIATKVVLGL